MRQRDSRRSGGGARRVSVVGLVLTGFLLAAFGRRSPQISVLSPPPLLEVQAGAPKNSDGRYLLDFGSVVVGQTDQLPLTILNAGRA